MNAQPNTPAGSIPPRPPLPGPPVVPGASGAPVPAPAAPDVPAPAAADVPAPAAAGRHINSGRLGVAAAPVARHPSIPPRPPRPAPLTRPSRLRSAVRNPRVLLAAYLVVLTLIAVWPVPVDSGAGGLLRRITRVFPFATYARIEFGANILLFVPLGILLALILRQRYLILPIALVSTVAIESFQALMLDKRTPSVMDIIANLTGAALGLLIVAFVQWRRGRGRTPAAP